MTRANTKYGPKSNPLMRSGGSSHPAPAAILQHGEQRVLQVKMSDLPRPDRGLTANRVAAFRTGRDIEMAFGQGAPGRKDVSAALLVSISSDAVRKALFEPNPNFVQELLGLTSEICPPETFDLPERTAFERANVVSLFASATDGEARFYRVSAAELHFMSTGLTPRVDPVAAVFMSVDKLGELVQDLMSALETTGEQRVRR